MAKISAGKSRAQGSTSKRSAGSRSVPVPAKPVSTRTVATSGPPASTRGVPRSSDPLVAALQERLEGLLRDRPLAKTRVGIEVMKASSGEVLFSRNAEGRFNPASNTKMLTTAAAMAFLGPDWRYRTTLHGPEPDDEGVVHGDVVLRGSGDPSLNASDLADLARELVRRGVTRVEGKLVVEARFRDPRHPGGPLIGEHPLILNRDSYAVHLHPTQPGQRVGVWIEPRSSLFQVDNQALTAKGNKGRVRVDAYRKDAHWVVTVRGRLGEGRGEVTVPRKLADGALYAGWVLRDALADLGIEVTGNVEQGEGRASDGLLAEHRSLALCDVSRISNKPSNNFVAEAIYRTLGAELYGQPGTLDKGSRAVAELLRAHGIADGRYTIVNGSGLTHVNRITASDLTALLRALYFDVAVAPDFLTSLAVAGIDGTIRGRFQGTEAVGLVRAKTGTLSGVSALSGYVGDKGEVLVFSIFVEGFRHKKTNEVRHAQVRLVQAMLRYLRATGPASTPRSGDRPVDVEGHSAEPSEESEPHEGEELPAEEPL